MWIAGCGSMPAKCFRHSAPSEMTVISPRPAYPCSLSAKAAVAVNSAGCVPSNAKSGPALPPRPPRPQWPTTASNVRPPQCLTNGIYAVSTLKTTSRAKSPSRGNSSWGAICVIKVLMPEPFAFGSFDAFAKRDRAMPECREFPGQMTRQKCR